MEQKPESDAATTTELRGEELFVASAEPTTTTTTEAAGDERKEGLSRAQQVQVDRS